MTRQGLFRYIMHFTGLSRDALGEFLRVEVGSHAEKTMKSTYDRALEEGMATLLLAQPERRFGPPPEKIIQRVRSATPEQLQHWVARVLSEETLDQVLAPD